MSTLPVHEQYAELGRSGYAGTPGEGRGVPHYEDLGCRFASSCFHCHLAVCAESPEGEGEAVILGRILSFMARDYEGGSSGPPPALPDRRGRQRNRRRLSRPATVAESARRLGVSRGKWYRLFAVGGIPAHLLPRKQQPGPRNPEGGA